MVVDPDGVVVDPDGVVVVVVLSSNVLTGLRYPNLLNFSIGLAAVKATAKPNKTNIALNPNIADDVLSTDTRTYPSLYYIVFLSYNIRWMLYVNTQIITLLPSFLFSGVTKAGGGVVSQLSLQPLSVFLIIPPSPLVFLRLHCHVFS